MPRQYTYSLENVNETVLRDQAAKRRAALVAAGCSTYTVGYRGGTAAIVCLCCGLGSSHPGDIRNRYCGFCKAVHTDWR